jgi:O-antigen/teichoic acid export membrane protein
MADSEAAGAVPNIESRSRLLVQGITWTAAYQVLDVALAFGSMLILVRILDARDYGRAAAVTGLLALIGTFGSHLVVEHALQLPDGEEPDWQLHWTAAVYIQLVLALIANLVAGLCWLLADYRPMAKLLHVASLGLVFEVPAQLSATMMRRELNLRRLRIVSSAGMMLRLATTTSLGIAGAGAYAIVIGSNVVPGLPSAFDLFVNRRWRPQSGWYRQMRWRDHSAALTFGLQRAGANVVGSLRGAVEAALLPPPLGFAALGLINRAQALYTTTFGRVGRIFSDAVYPFLPRSSHDRERYAAHATMYLRVMLLVSLPAALFVSEYGDLVSRALYGNRWAAMDPLIRPGALVSLSVAVLSAAATILVAAGRVRECLVYDSIGAVAALPAIVVAWITRGATAYSWACAAAEALVAIAALWRAGQLLQRNWVQAAVVPPAVAALTATVFLRAVAPFLIAVRPIVAVAALGSIFGVVCIIVLRVAFAEALAVLLTHAPAGHRLRQLARLRTAAPPAAVIKEA